MGQLLLPVQLLVSVCNPYLTNIFLTFCKVDPQMRTVAADVRTDLDRAGM
jgi:hypothetical protein